MSDIEAPCPLCALTFSNDRSYAEHLASTHGLVDDEGAPTTTIEHALVVSGMAGDLAPAAAAAEQAAPRAEHVAELHPTRVYDPAADDFRFKPMVLGIAGLALLAAAGLSIVLALAGR